jgi:type II pantothenate kinase
MKYLGGTGVGGGTLMGLSRLLLNAEDIEHITEMASVGDLSKIDLRISDITAKSSTFELGAEITASNFGNVSDVAVREDIASGLLNMVLETVGMISVFGARSVGVKNIVLTGNLSCLSACRGKCLQLEDMFKSEGIKFTIPKLSGFATVIGTALSGLI